MSGKKNKPGPNKYCKFYPCHKDLQDCTFCYCPFYPCKNPANGGKFVVSSKSKRKIWSCENCTWIHQKKVVNRIIKLIKDKKNLFIRQREKK
jgi:Zn-finger protein